MIPIYHSHGLDEVGSMVDYLIDEGVWTKKRSGGIEVSGIGPSWEARGVEQIIRKIEESGLEDDLRELVVATWAGIEKACEVNRRKRYV